MWELLLCIEFSNSKTFNLFNILFILWIKKTIRTLELDVQNGIEADRLRVGVGREKKSVSVIY